MSNMASLSNHFLIAMPSMTDPNFAHAVVYVCENQEQGSVGLIINKPMEYSIQFVFDQMHIESKMSKKDDAPLLYGGPIQPERGFVIHRPTGGWRSSLFLADDVTLTTSNDIIRAIAVNEGPKDKLIALGYSGWTPNQLELEIMNDKWLVCPYHPELLYEVPFAERWLRAGKFIGVDMNQLSGYSGHA